MSLESAHDDIMKRCGEDGIHIFDYLESKKRIQKQLGKKHDPRFVWDMYNKVIY